MAEKKSKLAEIKTKPTAVLVADFISSVQDEQKRKDSFAILEMMKKATGEEPIMWGSSIIGFGNKRYKSPTGGREVDWHIIGFAPRKANLSLYLNIDFKQHEAMLENLGKYKTGVGCLYIKNLSEINMHVLESLIRLSVRQV